MSEAAFASRVWVRAAKMNLPRSQRRSEYSPISLNYESCSKNIKTLTKNLEVSVGWRREQDLLVKFGRMEQIATGVSNPSNVRADGKRRYTNLIQGYLNDLKEIGETQTANDIATKFRDRFGFEVK